MFKMVLVGNCQVAEYAKMINDSRIEVVAIEVWKYKERESFDNLYESEVSKADIVISQPLSNHYSKLSFEFLQNNTSNLILIHNLYLQTFVPDCAYIGPMGGRIKSLMGTYHSSVIYENWLKSNSFGTAVDQIMNYSVEAIQKTELKNREELLQREKNVTIPCSDLLLDYQSSYNFFHVFNHPTVELLRIYLSRVMKEIDVNVNLREIDDPLVQYGQFPIYTTVQEYFNIKSDRTKFKHNNFNELSVKDFVAESFSFYDRNANKNN